MVCILSHFQQNKIVLENFTNVQSGITASDDIIADFGIFQSKTKSKKAGNERKFIVYRINGEDIVKEAEHPLNDANGKEIAQEELWETFCNELCSKPTQGAYGVFGVNYKTSDGRDSDGIVFVKFMDEDKVKVKSKMLLGSTMQSFKGELNAAFVHSLEANSKADLDLDALLARLKK